MDLRRPRAVIIHRDDNGYGLIVSGDNPVSVQTIKIGGAADVAGICEGDVIIKVNGTLVEHMNHTEVVNLVKNAGAYVTLTVRTPILSDMTGMPGVGLIGGNSSSSNGAGRPHHVPIPHERTVTAPLPVDRGVQLQMQDNKFRTLQVYRDQAAAEFEACWKKYESTQNPRDKKEFEKAEKSLRSIEAQMKKFRQSSPNLQLQSPTPFNPYPQSHQSIQFHPFQQQQYQNFHHRHPPGPNPPRNQHRNPLSSQSSVPPYPHHQEGLWEVGHHPDLPPPLPPRSISQQLTNQGGPDYSAHDGHGGGSEKIINSQAYFQTHPNNLNMLGSRTSPSAGSNSSSGGSTSGNNNQSHHRAKSSPDPVSMQKALSTAATASEDGTKPRSDSVNDLSKGNSSSARSSRGLSSVWDSLDRQTPPGSPPPPYGKQFSEATDTQEPFIFTNPSNAGTPNEFSSPGGGFPPVNHQFSPGDIMSMEEDDVLLSHDSPNISGMGKNGPWSSLTKLLMHNAHLAVFMNFVIGNKCDPSSLLFYLITGLQMEEGTLKEMKRWGYEIHSTFTAPGSPLHVPHVAENIADEIDDNLIRESDKEEMMRRVFRKARNKAKEEINKQLEEFCTKKTAGLGTMFGPPDAQLEECLVDKVKESKVIETYLIPRLDMFCEEYEKTSEDRTLAIINAVSTILQKQFMVKPNSSSNSVLERCGSFVSKEKSVKARFMNKHKKITHNGHHFSPQFIYSYTVCNICGKILWGVAPQGLQCSDCNIYVHRHCYIQIQDNCVGTEAEGLKKKDRLKQIKDKIRSKSDAPKRRSAVNPLRRTLDDNFFPNHSSSFPDSESGDKPLSSSGSSSTNLKNDKRPDTLSEERVTQDGSTYEDEANDQRPSQEPRRASNIVGRSESCKERPQRKQPRERRKHSDPNLTSKSSDVDLDSNRILSDTNNSSASNSSLSARSSDSPSTSLEQMPPHHSSSSLPGRHGETLESSPLIGHSGDSYRPTQQSWEGDSDIEVEQDAPDWIKEVPEDILSQLEPREKKRQEVLNELFHTERSHVRNLKVVDRLFHRPIRSLQLLPMDLIQMLFGSWEDMLEIHGKFNTALKRKRKENPLIGDIGPLLLEIFDGEMAEKFKKAAASCCARQQIGLKALKERREKNPKLNAFLQEAEQDGVCRRLQIQDMIPMVMQRLTKYPLMFSKLCHYSSGSPETEEYKSILRGLEMSKEILNSVNHSKKEAEDFQRLLEIQGRLDKSSLEKGILSLEKGVDKPDINFINELRNLDLTAHKLIHESPLHWKIKSNKQKSEVLQDVQLVLLNDMVVILLKQDERFILKIHTSSSFTGKSERVILRPVIKLNNLIIRANAADKKAFMLINMTSSNMYDLVCSCMEERKQWLHHITKAAEDYKSRQESRRSDFHPSPSIPAVVAEPDERKESNDVGEAGEGGNELESSVGGQDPALLLGLSPQKEASPGPPEGMANNEPPHDTSSTGNEKLGVNEQQSRNASPSPAPVRKSAEFLRVTETSPLIEPSEVVVTSRDIQFAQPVISAHEELKRLDLSISKALGDKMSLVSQMLHIPLATSDAGGGSGGDEHRISISGNGIPAKDSKELVVACMAQVDKLRKTISEQNISVESLGVVQEQSSIAASLTTLLNHLFGEINRKDEELESRRQELHRLREQNHGYHERLQKSSISRSTARKSSGCEEDNRPTSFACHSSPTSDHHDEDELSEMLITPSKLQFSATSSFNSNKNDPTPQPVDSFECPLSSSPQIHDSSHHACDLATKEYADAELEGKDGQLEEKKVLDSHSEESEEEDESEDSKLEMQASTLTLVPENDEELYVNVVGQRKDSSSNENKASNGHPYSVEYENVIVLTRETSTNKTEDRKRKSSTTGSGQQQDSIGD